MVYDASYNYLEPVLQKINAQYIALQEEEERKNSSILKSVLKQIIAEMRKDKLFNALYRKEYCGGSYYCGLKVGKPDEYDIDLLFRLPVLCEANIINSDIGGFVHINMQNMSAFHKQLELSNNYPELEDKLLENSNLSTEKVLAWMEKIINKALNRFKYNEDSLARFGTDYGNYYVNLRKQGPAFTLGLHIKISSHLQDVMSIDLVPCFVFTDNYWPTFPYRPNPIRKKNEFFVVPKSMPKNMPNYFPNEPKSIYWRLSFQEQENEIIKNSQNLKPALRLLKRIRDAWDHKPISSYFIKTIFLWEIEKNDIIWNKSLSYVFMTMLKRYQQYLEQGEILYYWNNDLNLVSGIDSSNLDNTSKKLKRIINDIEKNSNSPQFIEKIFYGPNWIHPEGMKNSNFTTSNATSNATTNNEDNSPCLLF